MGEALKKDPRVVGVPNATSLRLWLMMGLAFLATFLLIRNYGHREVAKKADYSWIMRSLDGEPVALSKYAGKPIFLNVWATWCGPCLEEMPSITKLSLNPKLKGVAFLCVATDESPAPVQAYVDKYKPPMTILHANGSMPKVFDSDGAVPVTYIIAPSGRIIRTVETSYDWDKPEIVTLLEQLQRESK